MFHVEHAVLAGLFADAEFRKYLVQNCFIDIVPEHLAQGLERLPEYGAGTLWLPLVVRQFKCFSDSVCCPGQQVMVALAEKIYAVLPSRLFQLLQSDLAQSIDPRTISG